MRIGRFRGYPDVGVDFGNRDLRAGGILTIAVFWGRSGDLEESYRGELPFFVAPEPIRSRIVLP